MSKEENSKEIPGMKSEHAKSLPPEEIAAREARIIYKELDSLIKELNPKSIPLSEAIYRRGRTVRKNTIPVWGDFLKAFYYLFGFLAEVLTHNEMTVDTNEYWEARKELASTSHQELELEQRAQ